MPGPTCSCSDSLCKRKEMQKCRVNKEERRKRRRRSGDGDGETRAAGAAAAAGEEEGRASSVRRQLIRRTMVSALIPFLLSAFVARLTRHFATANLSVDDCLQGMRVQGPGWDQPDLVLPSRYFFLHLPDGCDKQLLDVAVQSPKGLADCQVRVQVLRQTIHPWIIVRYRLLSPLCENGLSIRIINKSSGQVVARKDISSVIRSEECTCRLPDFAKRLNCASDQASSRISSDLRFVPLSIRDMQHVVLNLLPPVLSVQSHVTTSLHGWTKQYAASLDIQGPIPSVTTRLSPTAYVCMDLSYLSRLLDPRVP